LATWYGSWKELRSARSATGFADADAQGALENLLHMIASKERLPEMIIVPAHDPRAFAGMPTLSQASSKAIVRNRGT